MSISNPVVKQLRNSSPTYFFTEFTSFISTEPNVLSLFRRSFVHVKEVS